MIGGMGNEEDLMRNTNSRSLKAAGGKNSTMKEKEEDFIRRTRKEEEYKKRKGRNMRQKITFLRA